ncbi:MAG: helix-turn-helix transcriptional regulator [Oscillospiraceae bacterium]
MCFDNKATGIAQSTFSSWKTRRNLLSGDKAKKIANYFGVSVDYLMTGKEPENLPSFLNDEAREIARELAKRPDLKILFDTSLKVSADDLRAVIEIVKKLEDKQNM